MSIKIHPILLETNQLNLWSYNIEMINNTNSKLNLLKKEYIFYNEKGKIKRMVQMDKNKKLILNKKMNIQEAPMNNSSGIILKTYWIVEGSLEKFELDFPIMPEFLGNSGSIH